MRRIPAELRTVELTDARMLSPTVRELVFRTTDGRAFDFLAGQWVKLHLGGGIDRDYSIASAPDASAPDRFALAVTLVEGGPGSERLHAMELGTRVDARGPNGLFVREDAERDAPALYVGTGTGLAPLRAMLQEELRREDGPPQVLLFGSRTEEDILWREELEGWAARHPRFRLELTLSRADTRIWKGRCGWVQHHLHELLPTMPGAPHVYVCGLSKMVSEVRRTLKDELRLDRRHVHSERYD
ncbi:ferredoxin--NADP reductase [Sandaracinus amylolyticus]|uniref:2-polyprenylphenol hydroxylase n=1 Tax=Sandaracinus amylolyticus TaxID=927083 RepID=A0A0F6W6A1_9BACT|nr:FAD-dependent oxidoreductase [Sandaracinus amylolyticus]AKF08390.1 2-polyprenylphenol hydroxylase [Sandaracinus amylolyticus]